MLDIMCVVYVQSMDNHVVKSSKSCIILIIRKTILMTIFCTLCNNNNYTTIAIKWDEFSNGQLNKDLTGLLASII